MSTEDEWDVAVVGGGLAGMTAAVRSAELGLRTIVLEKGEDEDYPCNTRYSGGLIHVAYHDPKRDVENLLSLIDRETEGDAPPELARALAQDAGRFIDWLRSNGANFLRLDSQEVFRWCLAPPRPPSLTIEWRGRGPDLVLKRLARKLESLGGRLQLNTRVDGLLLDNGACTGVAVQSLGTRYDIPARDVIIADGGFQANRDLFTEWFGPSFDHVVQRGAATGTGEGLTMVIAAGAAATKRGKFYGHLVSRQGLTDHRLFAYPEMDDIVASAILVDSSGQRFLDEGAGGVAVANRIAASPEHYGTLIFDAAIWDRAGRIGRIPPNPFLEKGEARIVRADSVSELASRLGLPSSTLEETIAGYNAALEAGGASQLTPSRSSDHKALPIRQAPFMATEIAAGITYTMDGIRIDGHGRVLAKDETPIPGLYAAGASTGGLEGGGAVGYTGGLSKAGVFGLRAAEHIASLREVPRATRYS